MPLLLRIAQRILRNREDSEDVAQEAFINAFANLDKLAGPAAFGPWLKRIAVNQAISRYRSKRRAKETAIDDLLPHFDEEGARLDWPDETSIDSETSLQNQQVRAAVRAAIERLPESHRIVIVLRDIEELSTREAAALLGVEENALKVRLHRARAALRTLLEPVWREAAS
jgi:RNA polymerase sigma-70 factor (ECF subfamily)